MNFNDTIVASATPYGYGGLAVVRLSGGNSKYIAQQICRRNKSFIDRRATVASLYGSDSEPYDNAVVTYFKNPNSYTGEDVVEFSCHGSPAIVEKTIKLAINLGARSAEPGEYTRRAFTNGRIDLVQAESVAAIIHGRGEKTAQLNHRVLSGELSKKLNDIKKTILETLSYVEFELDISEDELLPDTIQRVKHNINSAYTGMSALAESFNEGRLLNSGASVVICGPPNAGKSTLFNALLNENRAIVSPTPGTTRDLLEAEVLYDGISVVLSDTAGMRKPKETIESEGVRRAEEKLKHADFILNVFDLEQPVPISTFSQNGNSIPVLNKCDLYDINQIKKVKSEMSGCICISAKEGNGLNDIKDSIKKGLHISGNLSDNVFLITQRQYDIVNSCLRFLKSALQLIVAGSVSFELLSVEIRGALDAVDRILGKTTSEEILNNIFSNFCVGK